MRKFRPFRHHAVLLSLVGIFLATTPSLIAAAPVCSTDIATPVRTFDSSEALHGKLTGVWLHCGAETPWPALASVPHAGMEITDDGQIYLLAEDNVGQLVRRRGFDYEFTSSIFTTSANGTDETSSYIWNVIGDTGSYAHIFPEFSSDFLDLRLVNMGNRSVYHRVQSAVTVPDIVDMNIKKGEKGCATSEALIINQVNSARELRTRFLGKWWHCKRPPSEDVQPLLPDNVYGIAFAEDGVWRPIMANGQVSDDPKVSGTYEIEKFSDHYQLNLTFPDGMRAVLSWGFSQAPVKLHLNGALTDGTSIIHTDAMFSGLN